MDQILTIPPIVKNFLSKILYTYPVQTIASCLLLFVSLRIYLWCFRSRKQQQQPRQHSSRHRQLQYWRVNMPTKFVKYKIVIVRNKVDQGLLHSFVRHTNQWTQIDRSLLPLFQKLPHVIQQQIQTISNCGNKEQAKTECKLLIGIIDRIQRNASNETTRTLSIIEEKLFNFIQCNVNENNYIDVEVNAAGKTRLNFSINDDHKKRRQIMVLAISDDCLDDARQIITVYFKPLIVLPIRSNLRKTVERCILVILSATFAWYYFIPRLLVDA